MQNRLLILLFILAIIVSCSVKRNSFKNRTYHKITSDFNALFNGDEAMKEEVNKINEAYSDDFTEILRLEKTPRIAKNDTLQLKTQTIQKENTIGVLKEKLSIRDGDKQKEEEEEKPKGLDRSVEKANKSIGNHSMKIGGKEYNPAMYRAYEMIGKTRYYRGKPLAAIEVFEYEKEITNPKKYKKIETVNRWLAKSYHQLGNDEKSEKLYKNLIENYKDKKGYKFTLYDYTQLQLDKENYENADKWLDKLIPIEKNRRKKSRLIFISAQLKNVLGLETEALEQYVKVRKFNPSEQMELKSYTNYIIIKKEIDLDEEKKLVRKLNSYMKKSLYYMFKDELYYALGLIYEKKGEKEKADEYFAKSLRESPSDPDNRMIIYRSFGEKYFHKDEYRIAKKYYDSAYTVAKPEKKELLKDRRDKLTSLDELYTFVKEKDSVLTLTKMTPENQKSYFEKYINELKIKDLEKKAKEDKENEKSIQKKIAEAKKNSLDKNADSKKWYFYNSQLKNLGREEFTKTWGNRPLADNWRRLNKINSTPFLNSMLETINKAKQEKEEKLNERYDVESYMKKIPTTEKEILDITNGRDSVQLKLGVAYYNYFKNVKKSDYTLNDLIIKPPLNDEITQKAYFNLFKMYYEEKNEEEMNKYKNIILEKYPNSAYAAYVINPSRFTSNKSSDESLNLYKSAFQLFKNDKFNESLAIIESQQNVYKNQAIEPKFALLKAYILAKTKGKEQHIQELKKIVFLYENTDEADKAKALIKFLNRKDQPKEDEPKQVEPVKTFDNLRDVQLQTPESTINSFPQKP